MDRFIEKIDDNRKNEIIDLKSNMDRFIGYNSDSVPKDFLI